jgi:hypothetical protein
VAVAMGIKMKKKILGLLLVGVLATAMFRFGMVAGATSNEPGSTKDPLITQSYLEKRLDELGNESNSTQSGYKKVSVTKGKQLIVEEGCEFVIYSGEASVFGDKGIIDLSNGVLAKMNSKSVRYANYLSPANESGVKATVSCVIYVKGGYSIQ